MKANFVLLSVVCLLTACQSISAPGETPELPVSQQESISWGGLTESFYDASILLEGKSVEASEGSMVDPSRVFYLYATDTSTPERMDALIQSYEPGLFKSNLLTQKEDLYGVVLTKGGSLFGEGLMELEEAPLVVQTIPLEDSAETRALYPTNAMLAQLEQAGFSQVTTRACAVEFTGLCGGILFYDGGKEAFWPTFVENGQELPPIKQQSLYKMEELFQYIQYAGKSQRVFSPSSSPSSEAEQNEIIEENSSSQEDSVAEPETKEIDVSLTIRREDVVSVWLLSNDAYVGVEVSEFLPLSNEQEETFACLEDLKPVPTDEVGGRMADISALEFTMKDGDIYRISLYREGIALSYGMPGEALGESKQYLVDANAYATLLERLKDARTSAFWRESPIWLAQIRISQATKLQFTMAGMTYQYTAGDTSFTQLITALSSIYIQSGSVQKVEPIQTLQTPRASFDVTFANGIRYTVELDASRLYLFASDKTYALLYTHSNGAQAMSRILDIVK